MIQIALLNTVRIAIFALLAIKFNKWWIVLFSALFLLTYTNNKEVK